MTVENCLHFLKMAEMYGLSDCKRETKSFILDNFTPVARNDDFRGISCDLFCEFLSDDRLRSQSELDVFKIALSWLDNSVSQARQAPDTVRKVLGLVRYGLMSAEQMECIYSNPLLLGEACREVLQVTVFEAQIPLGSHCHELTGFPRKSKFKALKVLEKRVGP